MTTTKKQPSSRHIVHEAQSRLHESGQYRNVLGVGYGQRRKDGEWSNDRGVTVFVTKKPGSGRPLGDNRLPRHLQVTSNRRRHRVPVDVIGIGAAEARFQVSLDDSVCPGAGSPPKGCLSWFQGGFAITAEHVTGFGVTGTTVYSGQAAVGMVSHAAYESTKLDAARIDPDPGVPLTSKIGASGPTVAAARFVTGDDIYDGSNPAQAYLPSNGMNAASVFIRHVHVTGVFGFRIGSETYYPTTLIMADAMSQPGDSGALLLGNDGAAIGLLTGLVDAPDGQSYTLFTELAPALDVLVPNW